MNTSHRPDPQLRAAPGAHVQRAAARATTSCCRSSAFPTRRRLIDLDASSAAARPTILEIGFGMGETTAAIAAPHPENDYLGIEVHTPGVGSLLKPIDERGLTNVRIVQHDAVEVAAST